MQTSGKTLEEIDHVFMKHHGQVPIDQAEAGGALPMDAEKGTTTLAHEEFATKT